MRARRERPCHHATSNKLSKVYGGDQIWNGRPPQQCFGMLRQGID